MRLKLFELKIGSNGIKQLRNNMKKYYQSKPAPRDEVSMYLYELYLYVTICTFIWNLGSARSFTGDILY